jgi:hypothetical protein
MPTALPFPGWETDPSCSSIHNHLQWYEIVMDFRFAEIGVYDSFKSPRLRLYFVLGVRWGRGRALPPPSTPQNLVDDEQSDEHPQQSDQSVPERKVDAQQRHSSSSDG